MFVPVPYGPRTLYRTGCDASGCTAVLVDEDPEEATDLTAVPLPGLMAWGLMGQAQDHGAWAVGAHWRTLCPAHAPALHQEWAKAAQMDPLWGAPSRAPLHTARLRAGTDAHPGWGPVHAARTTPAGWEVICGTGLARATRTERAPAEEPVTCERCILGLALYLNPPPAPTVEVLYRLAAGRDDRTDIVDATALSPAMLTAAVTHRVILPVFSEPRGRYVLTGQARDWVSPHAHSLAPWAASWQPDSDARAA